MASTHSSAPGYSTSLTGRPATAVSSTRPHIMVIDDSMAVRRVIEATFARVGMEATSFPDGMAALQALKSGEVSVPEVLLLDVEMHKMDGYEVARTLRAEVPAFQGTTIIMLTCHDGVVDRVRSRLVGARDFVAKPFRPSELVRRVRGYLPVTASGEGER